jgi:hypothetical protein
MDRKLGNKMIGHANFTPNKPAKKCYKVLIMLVGDVFFLGNISSLEKKTKEGHESYKGFFGNCFPNFAIFLGKNVRICHI